MKSSFYDNLPGNDEPKKKGTTTHFRRRIPLPTDKKQFIKENKSHIPEHPFVWLFIILTAIAIAVWISK